MKWYWAILITIGLLVGMAALLQAGGTLADNYIQMFLAIFGVWAAAKSGSVGWGLFVLFLWPIGFPCFLVSQYRRSPRAA